MNALKISVFRFFRFMTCKCVLRLQKYNLRFFGKLFLHYFSTSGIMACVIMRWKMDFVAILHFYEKQSNRFLLFLSDQHQAVTEREQHVLDPRVFCDPLVEGDKGLRIAFFGIGMQHFSFPKHIVGENEAP